MLEEGRKRNLEFAAIVNLQNRTFRFRITGAGPSEVEIPSGVLGGMRRSRRRWAVHHNHASDKAPSEDDVVVLADNPAIAELWSHGHGGAHFRLRVIDRPRLKTIGVLASRKVNSYFTRAEARGIKQQEWDSIADHVTNEVLGEMGVIKYDHDLTPAHRQILRTHRKIVLGVKKTLRETLNKID